MSTAALDSAQAGAPAQRATFLARDWRALLWIFTVMSVAGLTLETVQHLIAFGEYESRAGFVWGPFSPIYGLAAMLLTLFLEPIAHRGMAPIFVVAAIVGGVLEYVASWAMEMFWGVVAWSYLTIPFNFDGRTDLFHMVIWGALGLLWVKAGIPVAQKCFDAVNRDGRAYRILSAALAVFMAANIVVTVFAMLRADARTHDVAPQNALEEVCDALYPNEVLQARFGNMGGIGVK